MECWSVGLLDGLWRNTPLLQYSISSSPQCPAAVLAILLRAAAQLRLLDGLPDYRPVQVAEIPARRSEVGRRGPVGALVAEITSGLDRPVAAMGSDGAA